MGECFVVSIIICTFVVYLSVTKRYLSVTFLIGGDRVDSNLPYIFL